MLIISIFSLSFCIYLSLLDFKTGLIPRYQQWFAIVGVFFMMFFYKGHPQLILSIVGCVFGLVLFTLVRILSGKKLGLGDVWFSGFIGAFLGPVWWYLAIAIACVSAFLACILIKRGKIPFIPFLSVGTFVSFSISIIKVV